MGRLRDKVILITGGAGAVGSAVAEAVVRDGGIAIDTDLEGREGIDHALDVTSEADWRRVIGGGRGQRRPARRPGQRRRHRRNGQPSRIPTTRCSAAPWRSMSTARSSAANTRSA